MKIIGVIPLVDEEKNSFWMIPGYLKMLENAGALPFILPLTGDKKMLDYALEICGGFLFTGGHDVNPAIYGEPISKFCGSISNERDEMECYLLKKCVEKNIPALGICRGIQLMNACFGGSLYQDLPTEYASNILHAMRPPYDREVHRVKIDENSRLGHILKTKNIGVNSYHHQGIKRLAPGFKASAIAEDGLIEAIELSSQKFFIGLQWHPELNFTKDENSRKIIQEFVKAEG